MKIEKLLNLINKEKVVFFKAFIETQIQWERRRTQEKDWKEKKVYKAYNAAFYVVYKEYKAVYSGIRNKYEQYSIIKQFV